MVVSGNIYWKSGKPLSPKTRKAIDTALKSLAADNQLCVHINGTCMQPLINDRARVEITRQRRYWPGDILVKRDHNGKLVAHRLLGYFPRSGQLYFVTRADNAKAADAPVAGGQIIGRISGGMCEKAASVIPFSYRLKALGQFSALVIKRLSMRAVKR